MIACAVIVMVCTLAGHDMNLTLYRIDETKRGIFGELHFAGVKFKTVERPYLDNAPYISSVPPGTYKLVPHESNQHGETWALVNESLGVYQYPHPNAKRFGILIHVANKPGELQGCIGIGKALGFVDSQLAVTMSRIAIDDLLDALDRNQAHSITIVDKLPKEG